MHLYPFLFGVQNASLNRTLPTKQIINFSCRKYITFVGYVSRYFSTSILLWKVYIKWWGEKENIVAFLFYGFQFLLEGNVLKMKTCCLVECIKFLFKGQFNWIMSGYFILMLVLCTKYMVHILHTLPELLVLYSRF